MAITGGALTWGDDSACACNGIRFQGRGLAGYLLPAAWAGLAGSGVWLAFLRIWLGLAWVWLDFGLISA